MTTGRRVVSSVSGADARFRCAFDGTPGRACLRLDFALAHASASAPQSFRFGRLAISRGGDDGGGDGIDGGGGGAAARGRARHAHVRARLDEWDREHGHAHAFPHASVRAALDGLPPHEAHEVASIERRYGPSLRFLQA